MNTKNSNFLFALTGLFLLAAIFMTACSGGATNSGANGNGGTRNTSPGANNSSSTSQISPTAPAGASPAHYKGGATAAITIEEFADFQCPTCAVMHPTVQQIQAQFGDRIKIIFRNFPLQQIHPKAYDAAVAAEAAGLQGKFWEMQNQLFTNQQFWVNSADHRKLFEDYAQKIGLDVNKFQDDMAGLAAKSRVDADLARAKAINVGSTPSFYLNGRLLPYEQVSNFNLFRQTIENELQKTQGQTSTAPVSTPAATPAAANTTGVNSAPSTGNAAKPAANAANANK